MQCWVYFEFALFSLKPYRIDQSCCVIIEMNFHRSVFFQYHTDDRQTLDRPKNLFVVMCHSSHHGAGYILYIRTDFFLFYFKHCTILINISILD